jgi:hypothetical protein
MMNWALTVVLCFATLSAVPQTQSSSSSAQRKFDHIEQNAKLQHPDQTPTVLTETEVNAYLAAGNVDLPQGVKSVRFQGKPGIVEATTRVDFDEITASRRSANPLLMLFTGTHDVHVVARAKGSVGMGETHVQSVEIDGVAVPRAALQFFVLRYITPKYPEVGLDTRFKLPYKIDIATVGDGNLTITQK